MIIKKMHLNNFRQFKGNQSITFSEDEQRNITLLLGDNTSGKTTLLQAFLWCFYGLTNFNNKDDLLNYETMNDMVINLINQESVIVQIELIHQENYYIITRTNNYTLRNNTVQPQRRSSLEISIKTKMGSMEPIDDPTEIDNTISEILPEDLSDYFFYDTERFGNVSSKRDVTKAVRGLLGLTVLENIQGHIGRISAKTTVLGGLNASLSEEGDKDATHARVAFESAEEDIQLINSRIDKFSNEKDQYQENNKEIQSKLRNLKSVSKLQLEKEEYEKRLEAEAAYISEEEDNIFKAFNNNTYTFFIRPFIKDAIQLLNETKVIDKGIKDMSSHSINHILERGICICGTPVHEDESEARNHILEELKYLPPQSIGTLINNFRDKIMNILNSNNDFQEQIDANYTRVLRHKRNHNTITRKIKNISDSIIANQDSQQLELEQNENSNRIDRLHENIVKLSEDKTKKEILVKEKRETYQLLVDNSDKNRKIKEQMKYAEEILNWVNRGYIRQEKNVRNQLEEKINYYFNQMYHGKRRVTIDEKYSVTLVTKSDENELITDESKGLETVKNFSFIAGLMDLAKSKLLKGEENIEFDTSEPVPLVLDAPFSNADDIHVQNIAKVLPKVAEQLILIVMDKDWNYAAEEMDHKVGKMYKFNKKSEVVTLIEEVK